MGGPYHRARLDGRSSPAVTERRASVCTTMPSPGVEVMVRNLGRCRTSSTHPSRWMRGIGGPPDNSPPATVPRRAKMVADGEPEFVAGRASQAENRRTSRRAP